MATILYGNGLNLLTPGVPTWDNLLTSISQASKQFNDSYRPLISQCLAIPNTIQYDQVEFQSATKTTSEEMLDLLCKQFQHPWKNDIYQMLSELHRSYEINYLTTNYDLTLESYFTTHTLHKKDRIYNMYSYYAIHEDVVTADEQSSLYHNGNIWHIHGDVRRPQSIILGYNHYCKQITQIREYLPQYYRNILAISKDKDNKQWQGKSWVDLFFTDDIYIIGLGLGFAELDLWWILDLWTRCKIKGEIVNRIVYIDAMEKESSCKQPFVQVLQDFMVEYHPIVRSSYQDAYKESVEYIKQQLEMRK